MRKVRREEILDLQTYEERRDAIRREVMAIKRPRRVHLGERLTFLFENADTVRYQIQEMVRAERLHREADLLHELATYNAILGDEGELGCALLIEITDPAERARLLREWRDLPGHVYLRLADGTRIDARFDPAQVGDQRLSSVQYLRFPTGGRAPVAIGCDHPAFAAEAPLAAEQRAALAEDLGAG